MKRIFKQHIYLFLSIVSLLGAFSLWQYFSTVRNVELYISRVEKAIELQVTIAEDALFEVKNTLKQKEQVDFSDLQKIKSQHPFFVYKQGELVYWSSHIFPVSYQDFTGYYAERCVSINSAVFLVKKSLLIIHNNDYELVMLIPIKYHYELENEFLKSGLNADIFPDESVNLTLVPGLGEDIRNKYNTYLFSLDFSEKYYYNKDKKWVVFLFFSLGIIFLFLEVLKYVNQLLKSRYYRRAFLLFVFFLIALRFLMLYYEVPYVILDIPLFKPQLFAASAFSPSLGDLLINTLFFFFITIFWFNNFSKIIDYKKILSSKRWIASFIAVILVFSSFLILNYVYLIFKNIYFDSQINLDITSELNFSYAKFICVIIFILSSLIFFAWNHVSVRFLNRVKSSWLEGAIIFILGSFGYYLSVILFADINLLVFNINLLYISFIALLNFPEKLKVSTYSALFYLITCSVFMASVLAYSIYKFNKEKNISSKIQFGNKVLVDNDILGEYYLSELKPKVLIDPILINSFEEDVIANKEIVENRIKRIYFNKYFDKYDLSFNLFNFKDTSLNNKQRYVTEGETYQQKTFETNYRDIWLINEVASPIKKYVCDLPVIRNNDTLGVISIELRLKKIIPNSIHPIFIDKKFAPETSANLPYSYAVFKNSQMQYSSGEFGYDNAFIDNFITDKTFFEKEYEDESYHHLLVVREDGKKVVVSSLKYPLINIFSNFSLYFLILIFVFFSTISIYNYRNRREDSMSFASKVQIYLNIAFFVPLIVGYVAILSILSGNNQKESAYFYLEKAQNVSIDLVDIMAKLNNEEITTNAVLDLLIELSRLVQSDIHLYDNSGFLITASQQHLFDYNILSDLLNPDAFSSLVKENQLKIILSETIGSLNFNSAYVAVRAPESGEVLGVVSIPFFSSQYKFDEQIISILTTILNVFVFIFFSLIIFSYFSSKSLIEPLSLITNKIRRTTLGGKNEPIKYHKSDDEFGLLIGAYNEMLVKLEESRAALARSEKETAWRELAKQVAHEIKNPLTPMKLHLQQLQRVMPGGKDNRSLYLLLEQIDTLSDIASSFSDLTRQPIPRDDEVYDLSKIAKEAIDFHDWGQYYIEAYIPEDKLMVKGDAKEMSRVLQNLLLNGFQAVPESREASLKVYLRNVDNRLARLEIRDNGLGIPDELQPKVFLLYFSTKSTGSGIGLALAKRSIEQAGGSIYFETEVGKGTSFFIEMPLLRQTVPRL